MLRYSRVLVLQAMCGCVVLVAASAQTRHLHVYDYVTKSRTNASIDEVSAWTTHTTGWNVGSLQGRVDLPTSLPDTSALDQRTTRRQRASTVLATHAYPTRTAVALRVIRNDSSFPSCSAVLVGNKWVLTAAHCIIDILTQEQSFLDRAYHVFPMWDDGRIQASIPRARVVRAYVVSPTRLDALENDVALLELDTPIGDETGWVGLFSSPMSEWPTDVLGHRLSYPAGTDLQSPSIKYNGDTLFYRYGELLRGRLDVGSRGAIGALGESGSSVIIRHGDGYVTTAVLSFASELSSRVVDSTTFDVFSKIMRGPTASVDPSQPPTMTNALPSDVETLDVYDMMGRLILQGANARGWENGLSPGMYFVTAMSNGRRYTASYMVP